MYKQNRGIKVSDKIRAAYTINVQLKEYIDIVSKLKNKTKSDIVNEYLSEAFQKDIELLERHLENKIEEDKKALEEFKNKFISKNQDDIGDINEYIGFKQKIDENIEKLANSKEPKTTKKFNHHPKKKNKMHDKYYKK